MPYELRLVAYADDTPRTRQRIRIAIEESGGLVESVSSDRTFPGTVELTFAVRIGEQRLLHGVVNAVERLPRVAVMRVTEPRALENIP